MAAVIAQLWRVTHVQGFLLGLEGTKKPSPFLVDMEGICNPGSTGSHKVATERAVRKQIRYLGTRSATESNVTWSQHSLWPFQVREPVSLFFFFLTFILTQFELGFL